MHFELLLKTFEKLLTFSYGVSYELEKIVDKTEMPFLANLDVIYAVGSVTFILRLFTVETFAFFLKLKLKIGLDRSLDPGPKRLGHGDVLTAVCHFNGFFGNFAEVIPLLNKQVIESVEVILN